jgi:hypothetical protein
MTCSIRYRTGLHSIGELTHGMCVVDRRGDQGACAPGANCARAQAQAALQNHVTTGIVEAGGLGPSESVVVPACVELEEELLPLGRDEQEGVPVVEGTPGMGALLQIMLKRVWGVQVDKECLVADQLPV